MRLTTKRNGKNVIPLLMAACGIDLLYWRIDRENDLQRYLSGDAADKLAAYEDAEEQGRLVILPCKVGDVVWRLAIGTRGKRRSVHPQYVQKQTSTTKRKYTRIVLYKS